MPPPTTVPETLAFAAQTWPDHPALVEPGGRVAFTWSQLQSAAEERAARLAAAGIGRGWAVAIAAPTTPELVLWVQAVARAGAAVAPLNLQFTLRENTEYLERVGRDFDLAYLGAEPFKGSFPPGDGPIRIAVDEAAVEGPWRRLADLRQPDAAGPDRAEPEDPAWSLPRQGPPGSRSRR